MNSLIDGAERLQRITGGCINRCSRLRLADGRSAFLKENSGVGEDFFVAEAGGLRALREAGTPVPEVLSVGPDHLLLSWVESGSAGSSGMAEAGRSLARQHQHRGPAFGFDRDNYCGENRQQNAWLDDGHEFFALRRLVPQGEQACARGLLDSRDMSRLESICKGLDQLLPQADPVLIHGDLWAGNLLFDHKGEPVFIDPAVSWCWAEADLAMTRLFGGVSDSFLAAYEEVQALAPGFPERVPLYNLYHLLNHLNLFGAGYRSAVRQVLERFS